MSWKGEILASRPSRFSRESRAAVSWSGPVDSGGRTAAPGF